MEKDFLKELLNTHRANKNNLWNSLIVVIGGSIGLSFKALDSNYNIFEPIFVILGISFASMLIYSIYQVSSNINKTLMLLKNKELKK